MAKFEAFDHNHENVHAFWNDRTSFPASNIRTPNDRQHVALSWKGGKIEFVHFTDYTAAKPGEEPSYPSHAEGYKACGVLAGHEFVVIHQPKLGANPDLNAELLHGILGDNYENADPLIAEILDTNDKFQEHLKKHPVKKRLGLAIQVEPPPATTTKPLKSPLPPVAPPAPSKITPASREVTSPHAPAAAPPPAAKPLAASPAPKQPQPARETRPEKEPEGQKEGPYLGIWTEDELRLPPREKMGSIRIYDGEIQTPFGPVVPGGALKRARGSNPQKG